MPTINVTGNNVGAAINKVLRIQEEMFKDSLIHVLEFEFVGDYIATFSTVYDQLLVAPFEGNMSPNDKTAPSRLKPDVVSYVTQELKAKVKKLNSKSKTMSINAIENTVFGFPSGPPRNETDSLKLFYFYLVGTPAEFAFVSIDFIDQWKAARNLVEFKSGPRRSSGGSALGRFGLGFMVPMDEYKAVYKSSSGLPSPSQARHPFSGAPPIRLFEEVNNRINFKSYVEKAVALMRKS